MSNVEEFPLKSESRLAAVKAFYAFEINNEAFANQNNATIELEVKDVIYNYREDEDLKGSKMDESFLKELAQGTLDNLPILDDKIRGNIGKGWSMERLGPVLRSIIRIGTYELMQYQKTPMKVIIDEYVKITKGFFDEKEVGFVNGILDKIAHEVRI